MMALDLTNLCRRVPWKAMVAIAVTSLTVLGCNPDTAAPSGWQSRGPRSSAELPASDAGAPRQL